MAKKVYDEVDDTDDMDEGECAGGYDIIDVTPKTLKNGNVDATKKRK